MKLTDKEQLYTQYKGDPVLQIEEELTGSEILVYVPDGTTLEGGFTLKLICNYKRLRLLPFFIY